MIRRTVHPNRWFFWTIAVLLMAGLLLLIIVFQGQREINQNSIELTDSNLFDPEGTQYIGWKNFRSEKLGYVIRYPGSWQIEVDPFDEQTVYFEDPKDFNTNITVTRTNIDSRETIKETLSLTDGKLVMIDGERGEWYVRSEDDSVTRNVILIEHEDALYFIAGDAPQFEKIVTSLKFLNK